MNKGFRVGTAKGLSLVLGKGYAHVWTLCGGGKWDLYIRIKQKRKDRANQT